MKRLTPFLGAAVLLIAAVAMFLPRGAEAQLPGDPSFGNLITRGVDAWRSGGRDSAIRLWLEKSPLEHDDAFKLRLRNDLEAVQKALGKPNSTAIMQTVGLSPRVKLVYACVHHEDGPFFMRFLLFRNRSDWITSEIDYNVQVDPLLTPLID